MMRYNCKNMFLLRGASAYPIEADVAFHVCTLAIVHPCPMLAETLKLSIVERQK